MRTLNDFTELADDLNAMITIKDRLYEDAK